MKLFRKYLGLLLYRTAFLWPDSLYLKLRFYTLFGYFPNLKNPQTFNEKLNWLKLNYHNSLLTTLADKYEVKKYVAEKIGEDYVVKNLGVWNEFEEIDFGKLPTQFVLKTTGDSSGTFICKDKTKLDLKKARKHVNIGLHRNYYYACREWVYKMIKPRIIADALLDDNSGHELTDYKFWCFNGQPKYMYCTNKGKHITENFYDMDFKPVYIDHGFERRVPEFEKPEAFETMKRLAAVLSDDLPFVRVDFFYVNGKVYFGECTFYDWGGLQPFSGNWDKELGELLRLPEKVS